MQKTIHKFYSSFNDLDAEAMASCYHNEVIFTDPAFGTLKGEHASNMWRMLCASQTKSTFAVEVRNIEVNEDSARAHWEAKYLFSRSGRAVHNKIQAQMKFKDGLIIEHVDNFNLHAWAKQALGWKGFLLGGTSFFKKQLNKQTAAMLNRYEKKNR
ncbi:MAG: nuclear transport factor 2 family protein [Schleiferiaceae bacterium]|jgi:ketosteroid isomerase-like protein|nr:nuclear transport factor 2 family protein [Schleiferiaceae bacterium]